MTEDTGFGHLFQPCRIGSMALKNRIVMAPMSTNFGTEDGYVTQRLLDYYERRARGGMGLVLVEATSVDAPRGRGLPYQLAISDDSFVPGFTRLAETIRRKGPEAALQIYHAGLNAEVRTTHMQGVGPSANEECRELTLPEMADIVRRFALAAERAKRAGFSGVEIHAAHYYLLAHFLSLAWNKRRDAYGGALENRSRLMLEVLAAVRAKVGQDYPVWFRVNGREYGLDNSLTLEEAKSAARTLAQAGSDAIHVSGVGAGPYIGYTSGIMYDPPGNFVELAAAIKQAVTVPVIAVGKISLELGEQVLREGKADLIAVGRPLLADPDLVTKAQSGNTGDIRPCLSCRLCGDIMLWKQRTGTRCQVNAELGRERDYEIRPASRRRSVLVVGGGPAGMEAARVAALRGHAVTLHEKEHELGGQLVLASMPPHKEDVRAFIDYLVRQIQKLGVRVRLGTETTPSLVEAEAPEVVVLATGVVPTIPKIAGVEPGAVVTVRDVLRLTAKVGRDVAVIGGGMVGCEVADYLADRGARVTIIEMLPELAPDLGYSVRTRLLGRLAAQSVVVLAATTCLEVTAAGVKVRKADGECQVVRADTIVAATGSRPNRQLMKALGGMVPETYLAGDCVEPGRILEAVSDGYRIGLRL